MPWGHLPNLFFFFLNSPQGKSQILMNALGPSERSVSSARKSSITPQRGAHGPCVDFLPPPSPEFADEGKRQPAALL